MSVETEVRKNCEIMLELDKIWQMLGKCLQRSKNVTTYNNWESKEKRRKIWGKWGKSVDFCELWVLLSNLLWNIT